MPASFDEWSDQHWERAFARQSAQVETAKLVTTFSLAVASTLVATALQVTGHKTLDLYAAIVLGIGFVLTLTIIYLDRLGWLSRTKVLVTKANNPTWTDAQLMAYIMSASTQLEDDNNSLIGWIKRCAFWQVVMAGASGVLALVSLLL